MIPIIPIYFAAKVINIIYPKSKPATGLQKALKFYQKKRGCSSEQPLLKLKKTFLKNNLLLIYCGNNTSSITCIIPFDALMEAKIWALPFITGFPSTIVILIFPPFTCP